MSRAKGRRKVTSFLQKTYEIVNDEANAASVSWTSDSLGFVIKRVAEFTEEVLPRYFKHSNFASFVRQLNMYDFHKSKEEGSDNVFRHQFFIKDKRNLLIRIKRKSSDFPAETLSKTDCQRLLAKVQELQTQHQLLEQTVQVLRGENKEMLACNRDLLVEVNTYKTREEKLEALLYTFSTQLQTFTELPEPAMVEDFPERLPDEELDRLLQHRS
jgi:heat shock transcription factor 1